MKNPQLAELCTLFLESEMSPRGRRHTPLEAYVSWLCMRGKKMISDLMEEWQWGEEEVREFLEKVQKLSRMVRNGSETAASCSSPQGEEKHDTSQIRRTNGWMRSGS